jgi:hypothetical protein
MASFAESAAGKMRPPAWADQVDRWIFVATAGLFLAAILAGFVPDSVMRVAAVQAGRMPPFPLILHVHAVLMGCWVLLLLTQSVLVATGRTGWHRQLGSVAIALAPALVIVGFILIPTMRHQMVEGIRHGPPMLAVQLKPIFLFTLDIMLVQIKVGILFATMVAIGFAVRRRRPELHKRLMLLGVVGPLAAATDRMTWLPSTMPGNPLTTDLWPLVLIAPLFFWDLYRQRKVHTAYWLYFALCLALAVPMHILWGTPGWRDTAMHLLGIAPI